MIYKFPEGFKWGSATSAHQIEGDNHNDWSEWEKSESRIESLKLKGLNPEDFISGKACDSYNRYEEDFDIAKSLGQNIHRFSIEWSRIEPEQGKFDSDAMKHYVCLVKDLRERGIEPMVTLWHFTNPIWFAKLGGFLNQKSSQYFTRYATHVVNNLKKDVNLWITFNEGTTVYSGMAYLKGIWPPQHNNIFHAFKVRNNIIKSHINIYKEIKKIYQLSPAANLFEVEPQNEVQPQKQPPSAMSHNLQNNVAVGSVENIKYIVGGKILKYLGIEALFNNQLNFYFWSKTLPYQDFLGVNYYRVHRIMGSFSVLPKQEMMAEMIDWEIYPESLYHSLLKVKKFKKPIFITENGIADKTDQKRAKFIKDHLHWLWQAIQSGVDVRGYLYWSLLDNFEWARGYDPRFGLVEVDYKTFERKIRSSAYEYKKICETNILECVKYLNF